jgi:hypothetical protein
VGFHGREWAIAMAARALVFTLMLAPASAQPPSPYQDLVSELATKIASALISAPGTAGADPATLSFSAPDDGDQSSQRQLQADVTRALAARGVRVTDTPAGASPARVRVSCLDNLRERACVADIQKGATRTVVAAARPLEARTARAAPVSLEMQPLFSQRAPILDAVVVDERGDRLVVLDPQSVTRYQSGEGGWQRVDAQPISARRVWPRDLRGRVRVDGSRVDAFLPGLVCRSGGDGARLVCADEREPWPIGLDNTGIEANRNYFHTPEGLVFFGAAPLGRVESDANARWIAAGPTGALMLLDDSRRSVATIASGDDVAALNAPCAGPVVLVASAGRGDRPDTIRLVRVVLRQLVPVAAPVELPGRFMALWAAPGATTATAVSHDAGAERYDAFQIRIACDR